MSRDFERLPTNHVVVRTRHPVAEQLLHLPFVGKRQKKPGADDCEPIPCIQSGTIDVEDFPLVLAQLTHGIEIPEGTVLSDENVGAKPVLCPLGRGRIERPVFDFDYSNADPGIEQNKIGPAAVEVWLDVYFPIRR